MKQKILEALEGFREDLVALTLDLVRLRTQNPPGENYEACVRLLVNKLQSLGLETKVVEVGDNPDPSHPRSILLSSYGEGTRTVYFHGHYDVVPAADESQFLPQVKDGRIIGRGAADMKGGLAAMIYAAAALRQCRIPLRGRIALVFVPDEETGGRYGTRFLFDQGLVDPKEAIAMFTPEPTGGTIWNACRGAISLWVRVKGLPIHSTLQHQGVNAFEKMIPLTEALLRLKSEVEARKTSYAVAPGESRQSILMLGGELRGGTNFNIVPGESAFTVDRRINPEENLRTEKEALESVFRTLREQGLDLETEVIQEGEPAGIPPDHPIAQTLAGSVEAVTGRKPAFSMCPGLLEIRYYLKNGVPAIAYGPGLMSQAHGPEEYVETGDLMTCSAVYALTAMKLLAG